MAPAGPVDGGGTDEDDVAEEETNGGGQHIGNKDNRNDGVDKGVGGGVSGVGRVCGSRGVGVGEGAGGQQRSGQSRRRQNRGAPLPPGWKSSGVDVSVPAGTGDASLILSKGIMERAITDAQQVTDVIQQQGSDPDLMAGLRASSTGAYLAYSMLSLCIDNPIDNSVPSIWAYDGDAGARPVVMPMWQTPGLQLAVMQALIDNGADINAGQSSDHTPIRVSIASCNPEAFGLLMGQPGI